MVPGAAGTMSARRWGCASAAGEGREGGRRAGCAAAAAAAAGPRLHALLSHGGGGRGAERRRPMGAGEGRGAASEDAARGAAGS